MDHREGVTSLTTFMAVARPVVEEQKIPDGIEDSCLSGRIDVIALESKTRERIRDDRSNRGRMRSASVDRKSYEPYTVHAEFGNVHTGRYYADEPIPLRSLFSNFENAIVEF